jgi:hypothetical protein
MIAFSLLAFTNYHLCMLEEKKDARTKRNQSADWHTCYSKEDIKLKKYIFLLLQQPISKCSSSQFKVIYYYYLQQLPSQEKLSTRVKFYLLQLQMLRILLETTQVWLKVKI